MKRLCSLILTFVMVFSALSPTVTAFASTVITNPTVESAVQGKEDSGVLELGGDASIVGHVDIQELKTRFPGLWYVDISNTNATSITPHPEVFVEYGGTFIGGAANQKVMEYAGSALIFDRSNPNDIHISDIVGNLRVTDGQGATTALPANLIESVDYKVFDGLTPVVDESNMALNSVISASDLVSLSVGGHSVELVVNYSHDTRTETFNLTLSVQDSSIRLVGVTGNEEVYVGNDIEFLVEKLDNSGTRERIENPADYDVNTSTLPAGNVEKEVTSGGLLKITIEVSSSAIPNIYSLTVSDQEGRETETADFEVKDLPTYSSFELYEENSDGRFLLSANPAIYIKRATSISSQYPEKVTGSNSSYSGSTRYVIEADGSVLDHGLASMVSVTADAGFSAEVVSDPSFGVAVIVYADHNTGAGDSGDITVSLSGNDIIIEAVAVQADALAYEIYQLPEDHSFGTSTILEAAINDGAENNGLVLVAKYIRDGNAYVPDPSFDGNLTVLQNSARELIATAIYGMDNNAKNVIVPSGSISKWYDGTNAGSRFESAAQSAFEGGMFFGKTRPNVYGTVTLEVSAVSSADGSDTATASLIINDSSVSNVISVDIRAEERELVRYLFVKPSYNPGPKFDNNTLAAMMEVDAAVVSETDPQAVTVAIGTEESYKVLALYNNKDLELVQLSDLNVTTGDSDLFTVDGNGSILTVKATANGGSGDSKEGQSTRITVSGDSKSENLGVTLGESVITGITSFIETPTGIFELDGLSRGDEAVKLVTGNNRVDIPKGLSAFVYIVPEFSNQQMYDSSLEGNWRSDAFTPGDLNMVESSGKLVAVPSGSGMEVYASNLNLISAPDVNETMNMAITPSNPSAGNFVINGTNYQVHATANLSNAVNFRVTSPVVTGIAAELYDPDTTTDFTGAASSISGYVGEELYLRIKVQYSDGEYLDVLTNRAGGLDSYESGVLFMQDSMDSYSPAAGPTAPSTGTGIMDVTPLDVLRSYFLTNKPQEYFNLNDTSLANLNNGLSGEELHSILDRLITDIEIKVVDPNGNELAAGPNNVVPVDASWQTKGENKRVPGFYALKLNEKGTYKITFTSLYSANGFYVGETAVGNLSHTQDVYTIDLEVKDPKAERMYLVGEGVSYDSVNGMYRFDLSETSTAVESFYLYPAILSSRYYMKNGTGPLPDSLSMDEVTGGLSGIDFMRAADFELSGLDLSFEPRQSVNARLITDDSGRIAVEVQVLGDLSVTSPGKVTLAPVGLTQKASPAVAYDSASLASMISPDRFDFYTTRGDVVLDIIVGNPASTTIPLSEDISFNIKYLMREYGAENDLDLSNFPGQPGYVQNGENMLTVVADGANPGPCDVSKGSGSSLKFSPTEPGTYQFYLTTTNSSGVTVPSPARTITFTVEPMIPSNMTVTYGETLPITANVGSGTAIFTETGNALNPQALANGSVSMLRNESGSTTVKVSNESGREFGEFTVTMVADSVSTRELVPSTAAGNFYVMAEGDIVQPHEKITYNSGRVEYLPVELNLANAQTPNGNFLQKEISGYRAFVPAGVSTMIVGRYEAELSDGSSVYFFAQLDVTQAPSPADTMVFRKAGETTAISTATVAAGSILQLVVYNETKSINVTDYALSVNGSSAFVSSDVSGRITVTGLSAGTTTITASGMAGETATIQITVPNTALDLVFTTQPVGQSVTEGGTATFTAAASGGVSAISYRWEELAPGGVWTAVTGATGSTLQLSNVTLAMNGYKYRAVVTDGTSTITSTEATLVVNPQVVGGSLDFATQPADKAVTSGNSASFTVALTGGDSAAYQYQWERSTDNGSTWTAINNATSASYTVSSTTTAMNGYLFRCVAADGIDQITSTSAKLTVTADGGGGNGGGSGGSGGSGGGSGTTEAAAISAQITLKSSSITVGDTTEATVKLVNKTMSSSAKITWTTDEDVAAIVDEDGSTITLEGLKKGTATITAKVTDGGKTYTTTEKLTVKDQEEEAAASFRDVAKSHWAHDSIIALAEQKILNGYEDGTFRPDAQITRSEFIVMITGGLDWSSADAGQLADAQNHFADWDSIADWAKNAWAVAYTQGLMEGSLGEDGLYYSDSTRSISRQEISVVFAKLTGNVNSASLTFIDADQIAPWASDAVSVCVGNSLISGYTDGTFLPMNNITRAETAVIFHRYLTSL